MRIVLVGLALLVWILQLRGEPRHLDPSDMFRIEAFGEVVPSPDGRLLAFVRIRGKSTSKFHMRDLMNGLDRADIWLFDSENSRSWNLTDGAVDGSGSFLPAWSASGRNLAFLSTRGGDVRLWAWDRNTRKLKAVSRVGVEIQRPVWVSENEVLCPGVRDGRKATNFELDVQAVDAAIRIWPAAFQGLRPTGSALSTSPGEDSERSSAPLWKFEIAKGSAVPVMRGEFTTVTPAPTGRRFAALRAVGRIRPEPGHVLPNRNPVKYKLVVSDDPAIEAEDVVPGSIRWSRGGRLALQSRTSKRPFDWVVVGGPNLTSTFQTPPSTIVPTIDRDGFIAAADGRLWFIEAATGVPQVHSRFMGSVNAILWSDGAQAVVTSGGELRTTDLRTGEFRQLAPPVPDAEFKTFVAKKGTAVFVTTASDGTSALWYGEHRIAWINQFLAQIAQGKLRRIEYRSSDGRPLDAWLLLPPGHSDGHRLPTVVWVYAGLSYSDTPPVFSVRLNSSGPYNLQLLAARGYAVLLPSMPLKPEGQASDPYSELPDGVLPAVDKAIELGFSDPERVAVMGHSFGGYSVLGLITQTARFRAAISLSGFCNLMSLYGVLDTRFRFEDRARERLLHMVFAESGQYRMGAPPWEDAERYVRNSPLTYAGRVATPLLIVHGDMDYVPIQQAEEFFTAMYRQRKVASFVRYWGEGHIIQSPANVQDMWNRIFDWLQDHLR